MTTPALSVSFGDSGNDHPLFLVTEMVANRDDNN